MWYLNNSQDVIGNSHFSPGVYCHSQCSPAVNAEKPACIPAEPRKPDSRGLFKILTTVAAPLTLAVTEQENIRHIIGENCSVCSQTSWILFSVVDCASKRYLQHKCSLWLPDSAFLSRVHGGALFTVECLREGFKVLQRSHHPEQRERKMFSLHPGRRESPKVRTVIKPVLKWVRARWLL